MMSIMERGLKQPKSQFISIIVRLQECWQKTEFLQAAELLGYVSASIFPNNSKTKVHNVGPA